LSDEDGYSDDVLCEFKTALYSKCQVQQY